MDIKEQRAILKKMYATTPNAELSRMLGISEQMVRVRAYQMGIRKDRKYLSETNRKCAMKRSVSKKQKCYGK